MAVLVVGQQLSAQGTVVVNSRTQSGCMRHFEVKEGHVGVVVVEMV